LEACSATWSKVVWEKKWKVSLSYEVNRMAKINLSDTYERLLPKRQYKINSSKEIETMSEQNYFLEKSEGCSK